MISDTGCERRVSDEIEITPDMLEAGASLIRDFYDASPESADHHAEMIFRAMLAAAP